VARLHARAEASRWGVTPERFGVALARAIEKQGDPEALHLEDLALAVACADGHEAAWEWFLRTYRADLQRAAIAIAGGPHGEDLADALVADLFGLDPKGTGRRSLFEYFHGRSRLGTWLRALLARRHVDALRAGRRLTSLDAVERAAERFEDPAGVPPDPDRRRLVAALQQALDAALAGLDGPDRLRLACYHVDEMTLAQIGRLFREHEATVSRKLQRIRQTLRERVDAHLRERLQLGPDEIRDCYRQALDEGSLTAHGLRLVTSQHDARGERAGDQGDSATRPRRRQESTADSF